MRRVQLPAVLAIALLTVAGCAPTPTGTPDIAGPVEGEWGPLAVYRSNARMQARNEGVLVMTDRCVFLDRNGERELLVWPLPETEWVPERAEVRFRRMDGQVVTVRNGQRVVLGGGGSSLREDGLGGQEWARGITWVAAPNPECLLNVRFLVGDVQP